jgi:CBS-domain-containing membrane protein
MGLRPKKQIRSGDNGTMVIWDDFKELWKYYVFQSLLTGLVLFVVVLTVGRDNVVIIASMGATAFICFITPRSVSAQTKHVIGGHFIALICGAIFILTAMPYYVELPSAVALAAFLMVVFNVEHPPAAGTALASVVNEVTLVNAAIIIIISILITQCRYYMRNRLRDLI